MTLLYGDTGLASAGALKSYTTTQPAPRETLLTVGTNEIQLPTGTEPAGGTISCISYTVQQSDLPTIVPDPISVKYTAFLVVSGKNPTAGTATVSYSLYKNNVAISGATGIVHGAITTNNFWTQSHYRFYDCVVGDVLEVRLWTNTAGVYLDIHAFSVYATRYELSKAPVVQDVNIAMSGITTGVLTVGAPAQGNISTWNMALSTTNSVVGVLAGAAYVIPTMMNTANTYFFGRLVLADASILSNTQVHATNHPYYYKGIVPVSISFREVMR